MTTKTILRHSSVLAFTFYAAGLTGCSGSDIVRGSAEADNLSQGLQIGTILKLNGSYKDNTCMHPVTGALRTSASWSADISAMPGADPVVVLNDSGCVLELASVSVQDSMGASQLASAAMPFSLAGSYRASPMLFSYTDSGTSQAVQFYGNAKLTPADFSGNFLMSLVYSDARDAATSISLTGQYSTVVSSSVSDARVQAPNNMLSFAGVSYMKDGAGIVTSVSSDPTLTQGAVPGSDYVLTASACPIGLAATDAAYQGGTSVSINAAPVSADFGLSIGADLTPPLQACMIIANCDAVMANVCSYQLFEVTFN